MFQASISNTTRIIILCFALQFTAPARADEGNFKVGVLVCLTGECAEWGQNTIKGLDLAAEKINAQGGVLGKTIKFEVQDTAEGGGGARSVSAFKALSNAGDIAYYIGPNWTPGGMSLAPLVSKMPKLLMTSPSIGVEGFNQAGPNIFNTWPHDSRATKALAHLARQRGWSRAAIFSSQQAWMFEQGRIFAQEFKTAGGAVVEIREPIPGSPDLKAEALRIKRAKPDFVLFTNFQDMAIAARQLRELGLKVPFLSVLMDDTRIQTAEGAFEGTVFVSKKEAGPAFQDTFQKRFGAAPGLTSDTAYDALMIYAQAIEAAGSFDTALVQKKMLRMKYSGASGEIQFDEFGGIEREPDFFMVEDGKAVPLR